MVIEAHENFSSNPINFEIFWYYKLSFFRPGVHELNVIQKKVHELKQELEDRISEQAKFIQYREEMKVLILSSVISV